MSRIKKIIFILLIFRAVFAVSAQSRQGVSVFVPQITGVGSDSGDNAHFFKQLIFELTVQNLGITQTLKDADYSLIGTLVPNKGNKDWLSGRDQYSFRLELQDNKTGKIIADGELIYETPEDLNNLFPSMVNTLISTIPEKGIENEWRNKLLYLGGAFFWTPRIYGGDNKSTHFVNFGGGVYAEYHFLDIMSAEAGFELAADWVAVSANTVSNNRNLLLEIPVLVKFTIKPESYFMLEPYIGVHVNVPFYTTTKPPLFSALAGFQYGVKAGKGVVFIDPRFSIDIGKSSVEALPGVRAPSFQRYIIHFGIGYKHGILQKN
jgi:hypothetical protein